MTNGMGNLHQQLLRPLVAFIFRTSLKGVSLFLTDMSKDLADDGNKG